MSFAIAMRIILGLDEDGISQSQVSQIFVDEMSIGRQFSDFIGQLPSNEKEQLIDRYGQDLLEQAIIHGRLSVVVLLLDSGVEITCSKGLSTPVHLAAWCDQHDIICYLVEVYHCSLTEEDEHGYFPHDYALLNGSSDVAKFILNHETIKAIFDPNETICMDNSQWLQQVLFEKNKHVAHTLGHATVWVKSFSDFEKILHLANSHETLQINLMLDDPLAFLNFLRSDCDGTGWGKISRLHFFRSLNASSTVKQVNIHGYYSDIVGSVFVATMQIINFFIQLGYIMPGLEKIIFYNKDNVAEPKDVVILDHEDESLLSYRQANGVVLDFPDHAAAIERHLVTVYNFITKFGFFHWGSQQKLFLGSDTSGVEFDYHMDPVTSDLAHIALGHSGKHLGKIKDQLFRAIVRSKIQVVSKKQFDLCANKASSTYLEHLFNSLLCRFVEQFFAKYAQRLTLDLCYHDGVFYAAKPNLRKGQGSMIEERIAAILFFYGAMFAGRHDHFALMNDMIVADNGAMLHACIILNKRLGFSSEDFAFEFLSCPSVRHHDWNKNIFSIKIFWTVHEAFIPLLEARHDELENVDRSIFTNLVYFFSAMEEYNFLLYFVMLAREKQFISADDLSAVDAVDEVISVLFEKLEGISVEMLQSQLTHLQSTSLWAFQESIFCRIYTKKNRFFHSDELDQRNAMRVLIEKSNKGTHANKLLERLDFIDALPDILQKYVSFGVGNKAGSILVKLGGSQKARKLLMSFLSKQQLRYKKGVTSYCFTPAKIEKIVQQIRLTWAKRSVEEGQVASLLAASFPPEAAESEGASCHRSHSGGGISSSQRTFQRR